MSLEKDITEIRKLTEVRERRFRASIYVEVFVPETDDLEKDREVATQSVQELVQKISQNEEGFVPEYIFNPYLGGVATNNPRNLLKPLDREI